MTELWDIYDENCNRTGRVAEREAKLRGEVNGYHLAVFIYIVNSRNEWLIQRRALTKSWPGRWCATGGAVLAGEDSLAAAVREVKEELGITLDPNLMYLEKRLRRTADFMDIWVARADFELSDCTLDPDEVDRVRWVTAEELLAIVFDGFFRDEAYQFVIENLVRRRILWVVPYDPRWKTEFERIRATLLAPLDGLILDIVHVGSTSVEGLAAKPILDYYVVLESDAHFPAVSARLQELGYTHNGDGGIPGRERFRPASNDAFMTQHLYVAAKDNSELLREIAFRDYLRRHGDARDAYAALKQRLAAQFRHDIDSYIDGKHAFVEACLRQAATEGFPLSYF
jgi:GrpB-like predicted nucleotidyltransferase (UPF0157 family)/8-oxo-dGTP pyrophosphatase MutT (NUDIX family)